MDLLKIGDVCLQCDFSDYPMLPGWYSPSFAVEEPGEAEVLHLRGYIEPIAPYLQYPAVSEQQYYRTILIDGEPLRLYCWSYLRYGYGVWPNRLSRGRSDACFFDPEMLRQMPLYMDWFIGVSGFHKAMLLREKPVLHASYIDYQGKAILFTAPSGTGKSTQAQLWQQFAGAEIINGDRALLGKRQGVWHAFGYPGCGSSDICKNVTLPLAAIVVLEQGKQNRVEVLTPARQQMQLVSGMVLDRDDTQQMDMAFSVAQQLSDSIPVVKLVCTPDAQAVEVLRAYLQEEEYENT